MTIVADAEMASKPRGRWSLALLAVFTGVPCLLAASCTGQPASSAAGAPASEAVRHSSAVQVPVRHTTKRPSKLALRLMTQAAQAAVLTSYQGREVTTRWDAGGGTFLVSDIWHSSGGPTITQTQATGPSESAQPYLSADLNRQSPEGVLGVTATLVGLLVRNYVVTYAGVSMADNRAARVVEAWRTDDTLAARFWLDANTRLPLEREVYDPAAHLISQGVFVNVQVGKTAPRALLAPAAKQTWAHPLAPPDLLVLSQRGWVVPRVLPGGLSLFAGGDTVTTTGPVLDLAYSDGLYVVSVFEQHGKLASRLVGWQRTKLNGVVVYAAVPDQRSFTWTGKGTVYTLIADAPAQVVGETVKALPHDKPPGFWRRVGHGLARLVDLVNPFG